jgi:NAD(P)-dependent dehydrogenase (short-subunit alcohol dehydrogenase family)
VRVKDKVAIVTGAAQGIGRCYAETLAREGAKVVVVDLKSEEAALVAAGIQAAGGEALALTIDVSSEDQTKEMAARTLERFGCIDVIVNNAAIYEGYIHYSLLDVPLDYWQRFLDVNLTSVLLCSRAVVPAMIERGKGKIINQSSAGAVTSGNQYGVTKLGVQGLTVGLARALGKHHINVNCIAPGITNTAATRGHYTDDQLAEMNASRTLLNRAAEPQDIANACLFLASDESDFMTGQVLHVDGGMVSFPL